MTATTDITDIPSASSVAARLSSVLGDLSSPALAPPVAVGVRRANWERWLVRGGGRYERLPPSSQAAVGGALDLLAAGGVERGSDHRLERSAVRGLARAAGSDAAALLPLFVASQVWASGTANTRGPRYLAMALRDRRLPMALADSRSMVAEGELAEAYRRFEVDAVGPSYATTWFWASSLARRGGPVALRLDPAVIDALAVLGWPVEGAAASWSDRYAAYCGFFAEVAAELPGRVTGEHAASLVVAAAAAVAAAGRSAA